MARTDAERVEKLKDIRDLIEDRLAEVLAHPKPSYKIDGQEFQWTQYVAELRKQLADANLDLAKIDRPGGLTITQIVTGQ